jgi:hypothetical protein
MSARLLALCCLFILVMPVGMAASDGPSGPELLVYLRADVRQSPAPLAWMKRELTPLMQSAGYRIEWRDSQTAGAVPSVPQLVVVELRGTCGLSNGTATVSDDLNQLAATAITDGHVLPFATVNCANLNHTLGASFATEAGARRDFLYGRAMARVVAHELYHMIVGTKDHTVDGVSKPCFNMTDLTAERFVFEPAVLAKFRQTIAAPLTEIVADSPTDTPATGRQ